MSTAPLAADERRPFRVSASSGWSAALALVVAAAALTLPAWLGPVRLNDSFWIDWSWLDQFSRELAAGNPYPRWLPQSHGGLGSPVFYYYPPLAFYVGSLFTFAGFTTYAAILATFFLAYFLSGASMYWWLKGQSRAPLIGALVYVVAPYHAFNLYLRGAVAEAVATAVLPLVMLGIRKVARGERAGLVLAAGAYAALILSHLPLALLASVFLIGPYAIFEMYRSPRRLSNAAAALAIGIALAAVYLLPALLLEPYRDGAKLWDNPVLQPSHWTFWNAGFRASANYSSVLTVALALAVPLGWTALRHRSGWALFGVGCLLLAIGAVPQLWQLPLLRSVQFPFRLLPIAEFALGTSMSMTALGVIEIVAAALVLLATTVPITRSMTAPVVALTELQATYPDVPENLPPGERPFSWPSKWALGVAAAHPRSQFANGVTILPIFDFPAWRVTCGGRPVPTFPNAPTQLLSYHGPPTCRAAVAATAEERIGLIISLLGLAALLARSLFGPIRLRLARSRGGESQG